ncbi:energy transducer TonB [uncultured Draconibacterium sp.]|uniref:energy transducer TonB n=1 Tax=uncultured Draconibacterium sp. TaxID=1573823 RepID=UPI0025F26FBE|nr:energy transducer TonB [uncultured Draconibacterium sp.]
MKKLVLIVLAICLCMLVLGQNETPNLHNEIDEVEISPPSFTGIRDFSDYYAVDANYLKQYLATNINYPDDALNCGREGTEVIKFKVNALGKVTDIHIVNNVCPAIDKEILRVLENTSGMWKPGIKDGTPVTMEQEVSIVFSVSDSPVNARARFLEIASSCFTRGTEAFYLKGKSKKAERLFSQGIRYMPHDQSLLLLRGLARYEQGNIDGATEDWERLFELGQLDLTSEYLVRAKGMKAYDAVIAMLKEK